jgi:hypothetical protein
MGVEAMKTIKLAVLKTLLVVVGCIGASAAMANTVFGPVTVQQAGTYGNGAIFIILSANISSGCSILNRIDVPASNPQVKQILAIALQAIATGQEVSGAVNGCDSNTGDATIDSSYNSFFFIQQ